MTAASAADTDDAMSPIVAGSIFNPLPSIRRPLGSGQLSGDAVLGILQTDATAHMTHFGHSTSYQQDHRGGG
jgi:hypothetical protein